MSPALVVDRAPETVESDVVLSIEEMMTAFALLSNLDVGDMMEYEAPSVDLAQSEDLEEECPCWVIVVGFTFAIAAAYAAYCTAKGGHPSISFGWGGFKVACR